MLRAYPFQLSGGMQQRVMIALAMIRNPDLLILDEPTSALDVTTQAQLLDELDVIRASGGTSMLFISHDIALLSGFADRILVMYAGQVCEIGPRERVIARPNTPTPRPCSMRSSAPASPETGRLAAIPGDPPDPTRPLPGCPFAPRCPYRDADLLEINPAPRHGRPSDTRRPVTC